MVFLPDHVDIRRIKIGYLILDTAEAAVLDVLDTQD